MMKFLLGRITVFQAAALIGLWVGAGPVTAQESGQPEFQIGELIQCGAVVTSYFNEADAGGEQPTYEGLEQAIRDKYADIIARLAAFEDRSVVTVSAREDTAADRVVIDISFRIERINQEAIPLYLNELCPLFQKGELPVKFDIAFDGAYTFGVADLAGLAADSSPAASQSSLFYAFDHLVITFRLSGSASAEEEPQPSRNFPAGFVNQVVSLGDLQLSAAPRSIDYDLRVTWTLRGGSGQGADGRVVLSGTDLAGNNFQFSTVQHGTFDGVFSLTHPGATGALSLVLHSDDMADSSAAQWSIRGELAFPRLRLGDQLTLSDAVLSFDGPADRASLRGRVSPAEADAAGLRGTYDFAAQTFKGSVGDQPVQLSGELR